MQTIYTFKVYPNGLGKSVYRVLKRSGSGTLDKLCQVILDSFAFYDGHLYEFCMDNKMYSQNRAAYCKKQRKRLPVSGLGR